MNRKELLDALNKKKGKAPSSETDAFDELALKGLRKVPHPSDVEATGRRLDQKLDQQYGRVSLLRTLRPFLAVAAAILLVFVSWGVFKLNAGATPSDMAFNLDPNQPLSTIALGVERDVAAPSTDVLQIALAAYEKSDFTEAAKYLTTYVDEQPQVHAAQLFLGHALLAEQPAKAVPVLQVCANNASLDQNYRDYAQWFLAWAYLHLDQPQLAQPLLTGLAANNSVCAEDAKQLLKQRFSDE